uniref:Arpp3 n=1 Tax=Arundo donax TaxID=35708 RepID=A0A0A9FTT4_ARUDO
MSAGHWLPTCGAAAEAWGIGGGW